MSRSERRHRATRTNARDAATLGAITPAATFRPQDREWIGRGPRNAKGRAGRGNTADRACRIAGTRPALTAARAIGEQI